MESGTTDTILKGGKNGNAGNMLLGIILTAALVKRLDRLCGFPVDKQDSRDEERNTSDLMLCLHRH